MCLHSKHCQDAAIQAAHIRQRQPDKDMHGSINFDPFQCSRKVRVWEQRLRQRQLHNETRQYLCQKSKARQPPGLQRQDSHVAHSSRTSTTKYNDSRRWCSCIQRHIRVAPATTLRQRRQGRVWTTARHLLAGGAAAAHVELGAAGQHDHPVVVRPRARALAVRLHLHAAPQDEVVLSRFNRRQSGNLPVPTAICAVLDQTKCTRMSPQARSL